MKCRAAHGTCPDSSSTLGTNALEEKGHKARAIGVRHKEIIRPVAVPLKDDLKVLDKLFCAIAVVAVGVKT